MDGCGRDKYDLTHLGLPPTPKGRDPALPCPTRVEFSVCSCFPREGGLGAPQLPPFIGVPQDSRLFGLPLPRPGIWEQRQQEWQGTEPSLDSWEGRT